MLFNIWQTKENNRRGGNQSASAVKSDYDQIARGGMYDNYRFDVQKGR